VRVTALRVTALRVTALRVTALRVIALGGNVADRPAPQCGRVT
jgi:hypothetical protein